MPTEAVVLSKQKSVYHSFLRHTTLVVKASKRSDTHNSISTENRTFLLYKETPTPIQIGVGVSYRPSQARGEWLTSPHPTFPRNR